jgi:membrane protein required for colicin V production
MMLDDAIGAETGIGDRLGGAALGAIRVGLVATTFVLIFDQLVPAARQPEFLNGSHLQPIFSAAGQQGFRSLPPDVTATIERLKKERQRQI